MRRKNVRMLIVDTQAENLPALHLFRKLGLGQPQEHIYLDTMRSVSLNPNVS